MLLVDLSGYQIFMQGTGFLDDASSCQKYAFGDRFSHIFQICRNCTANIMEVVHTARVSATGSARNTAMT